MVLIVHSELSHHLDISYDTHVVRTTHKESTSTTTSAYRSYKTCTYSLAFLSHLSLHLSVSFQYYQQSMKSVSAYLLHSAQDASPRSRLCSTSRPRTLKRDVCPPAGPVLGNLRCVCLLGISSNFFLRDRSSSRYE